MPRLWLLSPVLSLLVWWLYYFAIRWVRERSDENKLAKLRAKGPPHSPPDHSLEEAIEAIESVAKKKERWAAVSAAERLDILKEILENLREHMLEWAYVSAHMHGYEFDNPAQQHLIGEVWGKGPLVLVAWLRSLITLYTSLAKHGRPPYLPRAKDLGNGTWQVTTYGMSGHGWLGLASDDMSVKVTVKGPPKQFNPLSQPAGLTGILGAGNFDGPSELMHALFLENRVVVFKVNPVVKEVAPVLQKILKPLISRGFLAMLIGEVNIGQAVTNYPLVDSLCITGSHHTYDAIVWADKEKKRKQVAKPFKAELGSVNPWIVCPGEWTAKEIDRQAQHLVAAKMFNAGHICASPQVILTSKSWSLRQEFLAAVKKHLSSYPGTRMYYPQSDVKYKTAIQTLASELKMEDPLQLQVQTQATCIARQTPCIFSTNLSQQTKLAQIEHFCPVLVEIPLDTHPSVTGFLPEAVRFANEKMWGSLTGTLIIDCASRKKAQATFEQAVQSLQVGVLGINKWAAYGVVFPQGSWGAYPKHTPEDIQSGQGIVGNVWCLENVVSTLLDCPFAYLSVPNCPRSIKARRVFMLQQKRVAEFFLDPGLFSLLGVVSALVLQF